MARRLPAGERRAQLLEAAIELSEEAGLGALTIRAVAERAGVSLGVVHYCFVDKEELVNAVIDSVNEEFAGAARAFLSLDFATGETGPDALRARLVDALDLVWAVIESGPNRQLLTYEIVAYVLRNENPDAATLALAQYEGYDGLIDLVLQRCGEAAQMVWEERPGLVRAVGALLDGVALRWLVDGDREAAHQSMRRGIEMSVHAATSAGSGSASA